MTPKQAVGRLMATLSAIREIDEELPTQTAQCLIAVALQPGLTMADLGDRVGLSQASCSRNMASLGPWHRLGKPGFGLVETIEDPVDRRRKIMFLTQKGRERISKILGAAFPEEAPFVLDRVTAKDHLNLSHRGSQE